MRVDLCESTLMCFRNTVYLGLNYEGVSQSLADYRDKIDHDPNGSTIRWTVDLLFYVVVIVMLLNIIFVRTANSNHGPMPTLQHLPWHA